MNDKEKLISEILKLGFEDVTDTKPIKMIEQFDETYDLGRMHAYSHRLIKKEFGFQYQLLLEFEYKRVEIEGKAIDNFGCNKFHFTGLLGFEFVLVNTIKAAINAIKRKVYLQANVIEG